MSTLASNALFTLTESAANRIKVLLSQLGNDVLGVRIGVRQRGCSGNAYTLDYVYQLNEFDVIVESQGIKLFIDPKAVLFIIGTEMDYIDDKIESGFKFRNPNEKGRCGCQESFYV